MVISIWNNFLFVLEPLVSILTNLCMREQIKLQLGIITSSSILCEAAGIQPPIPNIDLLKI